MPFFRPTDQPTNILTEMIVHGVVTPIELSFLFRLCSHWWNSQEEVKFYIIHTYLHILIHTYIQKFQWIWKEANKAPVDTLIINFTFYSKIQMHRVRNLYIRKKADIRRMKCKKAIQNIGIWKKYLSMQISLHNWDSFKS